MNDRFALLDVPEGPLGQSESSLQRSETVNGDRKDFAAKVTRDGSACRGEIGGKVVYETEVWSTIPVVAFGEGKLAQPYESKTTVSTGRPMLNPGLLDALAGVATRRDPLRTFLKTQFGVLCTTRPKVQDLFSQEFSWSGK